MAEASERWWLGPQIWVEAFAILNVGFLTFDIYLAHSVNQFRNQAESLEWAQWVLLLTLGGFVGNFIFSLADHAGYRFFNPLEWVPVVARAIAIGFLAVPLIMRVPRKYVDLCAAILLLEAGVGLWGFVLHARANLRGPSVHPFDNFVFGAPPMAPLLFPNLMVLGIIALWQIRNCQDI
jgi:hypothetical protein